MNVLLLVDVETGVTHQLRSWFERAVNSDSTKHSALIWRLYMFFEVLPALFVVVVVVVVVVIVVVISAFCSHLETLYVL